MPTYGSVASTNIQTYPSSPSYTVVRPSVAPSYAQANAQYPGGGQSYPGMPTYGQSSHQVSHCTQQQFDYGPRYNSPAQQPSYSPMPANSQNVYQGRPPDDYRLYGSPPPVAPRQLAPSPGQYQRPYYQSRHNSDQDDYYRTDDRSGSIPQVVVVPDEDSASGNEDESEVIYLVKTSDGRYLPVALGNGGNISRVPSPAPPIPERYRAPRRSLYAVSDSESSAESLDIAQSARPMQPKFGMTREEWMRNSAGAGNDLCEDEDSAPPADQGLNLNRRYDYLPPGMVPFWYRKKAGTAPEGTRKFLCATCRHIDILSLFRQEEVDATPNLRDYIVLGSLESILTRQGCGFCTLVGKMIAFDTGIGLSQDLSAEEKMEQQRQQLYKLWEDVYYLCPIRFKTSYREPALYIMSGKEIAETVEHSTLRRPRRSMAIAPMHNLAPNHGRILRKPDQIDFEWVRQCMRLCDERDVGKLNYVHKVNVRAIDVQTLCVVPLEDAVRYVTLSYVWGQVTTLKLQRNSLKTFEEYGLRPLWDQIPKTIRDSIELVRKIGERYIWVDALCIVQDDKDEMMSQIGEMGNIYRNSILTICVCCGEDASFGIPGIEPGTRNTRQIAEIVGEMPVCNTLSGSEDYGEAKWDTRGWTLQEKVLSQRKLLISDTYAKWWCWHTSTSEDQNCRHSWWDVGTAHRGMHFYKSEHDLVVSKVPRNCNLDTYAFMVADYTARHLTHASDAEIAILGVLRQVEGLFVGKLYACIPDTEISAALLWTPIGPSRRRIDPATGTPPFPSWSWLGWVGHVAYPWLIERSFPTSERGSPLLWRNMSPYADIEEEWFSGGDYRSDFGRLRFDDWSLSENDKGWTWEDSTDPHHLYLHPVDSYRGGAQFFRPGSLLLQFRTLSADFQVEGIVRVRKENHDHLHKVHYMRIMNSRGFCIGSIHVPEQEETDPELKDKFCGMGEFIVLSRASTNPDATIGQELLGTVPIDELHSVYSLSHTISAFDRLQTNDTRVDQSADELAYFDTRMYDSTTPWGLFNVLMIERLNGVASRLTMGRIHVAAFMEAGPMYKDIVLQ